MKIEDMDFTVRTYHALKRGRIDTVEQLQRMTDDDLLMLRNFGVRCLEEIRSKVQHIPTELPHTQSIGDKIRAMFATDEGIAKILLGLEISFEDTGREFTLLYCDGKNNCVNENGGITCTDEMRKACILRWLRQPAEETPRPVWPHEDKQESGLLEED